MYEYDPKSRDLQELILPYEILKLLEKKSFLFLVTLSTQVKFVQSNLYFDDFECLTSHLFYNTSK